MYLNFSNFRGRTSAGGRQALVQKRGQVSDGGGLVKFLPDGGDPPVPPQEKNPAGQHVFWYIQTKICAGVPPSRHWPEIKIYRSNILPFYRAICISIYPLHSDKWWYTSPPPSAMVVAHFTPPSGREGNTPPHPHPWGVTMHLAPETTMTMTLPLSHRCCCYTGC